MNDENEKNKKVEPTKRKVFKSQKTKSYVINNKNAENKTKLESMTREELIAEASRLNNHVFQLKNLLEKSSKSSDAVNSKKYKERPFDFNRYHKRHVFLKFAYLGWNYQGYTIQEGINSTVEHHLFEAFKRTKLIESRETSNYHRCGRTDKGVSAFSQVVSIDFRSNCSSGIGVIVNPECKIENEDIKSEINFVKLLNGVLPDEIRAIAWSPVSNELSARFDCVERIYRYYFPKGDLDIDLMKDASKRLIGEHDFRNFCKMDVANGVVTFFRRIDNIDIKILDEDDTRNSIYSTVELIVEGSSFLWHQIRCVVAILLLVGQKKEEPSIIDDLLNIEKYACKPQYTMVSESPLILFDCQYENLKWIYDFHELEKVIKHFQDAWLINQTKAVMIKRMIDSLEENLETNDAKNEDITAENGVKLNSNQRTSKQPYKSLQGKSQSLNYVKFEMRQKAHSLESRVDHYIKKRRLDSEVYEKINDSNNLAKSLNLYNNNKQN